MHSTRWAKTGYMYILTVSNVVWLHFQAFSMNFNIFGISFNDGRTIVEKFDKCNNIGLEEQFAKAKRLLKTRNCWDSEQNNNANYKLRLLTKNRCAFR